MPPTRRKFYLGERTIGFAKKACTDLDSTSSLPIPTTPQQLSDLNVIVDGLVAQGKFTWDKTVALGGTNLAQSGKWTNSGGRKRVFCISESI